MRAARAIMKAFLTSLILFSVALGHAQSVTLAWSPSPSPGVVGSKLYWGTNSGHYIFCRTNGLETNATVKLSPLYSRWFFAITAFDGDGDESDFSNEVEWKAKPVPPVLRASPWVRLTPIIERSTNLVEWRSVEGESSWFPATNAQEFFATRRLLIERVQLVEGQ